MLKLKCTGDLIEVNLIKRMWNVVFPSRYVERKMRAPFGFMLGALLIACNGSANAKECWNETNVIKSTQSAEQNDSDRGHVSEHVVGHKTMKDNSLFEDWADFTSVFAAWQKLKSKSAAMCNKTDTGSRTDCIDLKLGKLTIKGQLCTAIDAKGVCTAHTDITPVSVVFQYLNNADTKDKWIMRSAYPSKSACK